MKFKLIKLLKKYKIEIFNFVDVGAMGSLDYIEELDVITCIIGFEPNKIEAQKLHKKYERTPFQSFVLETDCLSDKQEEVEFNILKHSSMSSLLDVDIDNYKKNFGLYREFDLWKKNIEIEQKIKLKSTTIDNYFKENIFIDFLKLDTQGSELKILQGALKLIEEKRIAIIKVEVTTIPVYKNQVVFSDIDLFLRNYGYVLVDFLTYRAIYNPLFGKSQNRNNHYGPCGDAIYILNTEHLNESSKIRSAVILNWLGYISLAKHLISTTILTSDEQNYILNYNFKSFKKMLKQFLINTCPPMVFYYIKKVLF